MPHPTSATEPGMLVSWEFASVAPAVSQLEANAIRSGDRDVPRLGKQMEETAEECFVHR